MLLKETENFRYVKPLQNGRNMSGNNDSEVKRFTNYILMLEHEIVQALLKDSETFKTSDFREYLRESTTRALTKVLVAKLMSNLQEKRAFNKSFINDMFGRNVK